MCEYSDWLMLFTGLLLGLFICLMAAVISHVDRPRVGEEDEHEELTK